MVKNNRPPKLQTRTGFREGVLARDGYRCVNCGAPGIEIDPVNGVPLDAHHIRERGLWSDGGYYLENGATLCDPTCHMLAEQTLLSCEELQEKCGITVTLLPPHLYEDERWDKWGNLITADGRRLPGEFFWDESVQKILAPVLHLFSPYVKAPRTWHLPWSPGKTPDDRVLPDTTFFHGKRVVVTAKMDGENTSMYRGGYVHARKVAPLNTPDSERIKALAAEFAGDIPEGWRICGENLIRQHTIHYENLPPHRRWFFNLFNVWNDRNVCLSWDEIKEWADLLEVPTAPVLYDGVWDEALVRKLWTPEREGDPMEGYVVRTHEGFCFADYRKAVGKFVREKFQVPQTHKWRYASPVFNAPRGVI